MAKAKAMKEKDDFEVGKAKIRKLKVAKTKRVAKDDSEITKDEKQNKKAKALIQKELDAWAKDNEPEEGWGLVGKKYRYKEIKLRKKFLEEKPGMSWVRYFQSNDAKIIREDILFLISWLKVKLYTCVLNYDNYKAGCKHNG